MVEARDDPGIEAIRTGGTSFGSTFRSRPDQPVDQYVGKFPFEGVGVGGIEDNVINCQGHAPAPAG
jgi:hypothetical protein